MLTVASAEGVAYAKKNDYKLKDAALGYVLEKPPVKPQKTKTPAVNYDRWAYSMALLNNALN